LTDITKILKKATGKLPTKDTETHEMIVGALIESWAIKRPQEVMLVNRMVSTWMKLRSVEKMLATYDLFFEKKDEHGVVVGISMNQLAFYLKSLEQEFRQYYKTLEDKFGKLSAGKPEKDFLSFLEAETVDGVEDEG